MSTETTDARDAIIERLREQWRAISGVMRAVARSEGLQPVLDEVVDAATRLCSGEYGSLHLLECDLLPAVSHSGGFEQWEYDEQHPRTLDRGTIVGRAAVAREPVHIPDVHADPEYGYAGPRAGFRAGLGVPILRRAN
jgi:GAF domain-containing protein